jgi:hypothetical protein
VAYVLGCKVDVFISYPMEAEEWAKQFYKVLIKRLGQKVKDAEPYLASRNFRAGDVARSMLDNAGQAAIFLAIISQGSIEDPETKRFQAREVEAFRKQGPAGDRFIPILLESVSGRDIARVFLGEDSDEFVNTHNFFFENENGQEITLDSDVEPRPGEFTTQVASLAALLAEKLRAEKLRRLKQFKETENLKAGPFAGLTVLLAPLEPNLKDSEFEEEWTEIRELLFNDGVTILPEQDYQEDLSGLEQDLNKADMFVQILGLEKWERAKRQFAAASRVASQRELSILQWRMRMKTDTLPDDDRNLLEAPTVHATGFRGFPEFKNEIRKRLNETLERKRNAANEGTRPTDKPHIYITVDTSDLPLARRLQIVGRKFAYPEVMVDTEEERPRDFNEALQCTAGLVFLYGDTKPRFINLWGKRYIRDIGDPKVKKAREERGLDAYPKLLVLYYAPPKKEVKEEEQLMIPFELRPAGSQEQLVVEDFERICAELAR